MAGTYDIAGSASLSTADAFDSKNQISIGGTYRVLGSGTLNAKVDEGQSLTSELKNTAEAVAATAKAGDGGSASATSALTKGDDSGMSLGGLAASTGLSTSTLLLIGGGVLAAGAALLIATRNRKGGRRR